MQKFSRKPEDPVVSVRAVRHEPAGRNRPPLSAGGRGGRLEDLVSLFEDYRGGYGCPPDPGRARQFLSERMTRADSFLFLARDATQVVGFAQLYPSLSSLSLGKIAGAGVPVPCSWPGRPDSRDRTVPCVSFSRPQRTTGLRRSSTVPRIRRCRWRRPACVFPCIPTLTPRQMGQFQELLNPLVRHPEPSTAD